MSKHFGFLSDDKNNKKHNHKMKSISSDKDVSLFKDLIDILPSGVFIKNAKGKYLLVNKYVDEIIHGDGSSLMGKYDSEVFPQRVCKKLWEIDRQVLNSKKTKIIETVEKIPTKLGEKHFLTKKVAFPSIFDVDEEMILAVTNDITELKQVQDELNTVNSLLRKVTQLVPDIIFLLDLDTNKISNSNIAFHRMLGYNKEIVENHPGFWFLIMHPEDRLNEKRFTKKLKSMDSSDVYKFEVRYRKDSGSYLWANTIITPFNNINGQVNQVLIAIEDIHKLKTLQQKYQRESYYDHLTKIYNRRFFMRKLAKTLSKEKSFTLLFVDLDKFKCINDTYGHDIGDKLLVETAKRLRTIFRRESDVVARLGGDEFVILIRGELGDKINSQIPEKLKAQFVFPYEDEEISVNYKPSIGAVYIDSNYDMKPEDVLHKADQAMYKAKKLQDLGIVVFKKGEVGVYKN